MNASVALGAVWLVALFAAMVSVAETLPPKPSLGTAVPRSAAVDWQIVTHDSPRFSVSMPVEPVEEGGADAGLLVAVAGNNASYSVSWTTVGDGGERWLALQNDTLLKRGHVVSDNRIDEHERRSTVELPGGEYEVARLVVADGMGYMVVATAPPGHDSVRFVESFQAR